MIIIPLASLNNHTLKISTTGLRFNQMQSHHEQETQEFILGKPKLGKNLATLSLEEVQQVQYIFCLRRIANEQNPRQAKSLVKKTCQNTKVQMIEQTLALSTSSPPLQKSAKCASYKREDDE